MQGKTYQWRECAGGCAFGTTIATLRACDFCGGPLGATRTLDREGVLTAMRREAEYRAAKAGIVAWLASRQS